MSAKRLVPLLAGLIGTLALGSVVRAQNWQPFIEPGYFNHDLQFFAPATDIDTYGGPVLRTGWFGTYSRMYVGVSRPDTVSYTSPYPTPFTWGRYGRLNGDPSDGLDVTWGNRLDLGYMIDDVNRDHGWLFSYMHVDGPNTGRAVHQQRINRLNEDDEGYQPPTDDQQQQNGVEPASDRNNSGPPNRERFYDVTDSLNMGKFTSLELNKLFRMEPLNHGGILEPFLGVRYIHFEDVFLRQQYWTYDDNGVSPAWPPLLPVPVIPPGGAAGAGITVADATIEDLVSDRFGFVNDMFGGQLGVRWLKRASRWNLSSETRFFALHNWQHLRRSFDVERTYYDGGGQGSTVTAIVPYRETTDAHTTSTVVGMDIRAEVAYEVTRDVALTAGMQFLGFYNGIGRGPSINANSQEMYMLGATFGVIVNR